MPTLSKPFRYFDSSPEVIRLVVMMYVRYPLSPRNVEDLLFERGIDICHETVRQWWNRFLFTTGYDKDGLAAAGIAKSVSPVGAACRAGDTAHARRNGIGP
jgi:hypothetical protein